MAMAKLLPPLDSGTERELVKAGKIKSEHARFCPADASLAPFHSPPAREARAEQTDKHMVLHNGTGALERVS